MLAKFAVKQKPTVKAICVLIHIIVYAGLKLFSVGDKNVTSCVHVVEMLSVSRYIRTYYVIL